MVLSIILLGISSIVYLLYFTIDTSKFSSNDFYAILFGISALCFIASIAAICLNFARYKLERNKRSIIGIAISIIAGIAFFIYLFFRFVTKAHADGVSLFGFYFE